jgi:hypothetical protein
MANSSEAPDHNFGAIEAAVKETARGRAFLADYARKVRQSDTLTMLAMIGRLERWCQDLAVRFAEIEGCNLAAAGRAPEGHASLAPILRGGATEQMIGRREALLDENHFDVPAVIVRHEDSPRVEPTSDDAASKIVAVGQAKDRLEHLANTFHDLDRRVADLTGHYRVAVRFKDTGLLAPIAASGDEMRTMTAHTVAPDCKPRFAPGTEDKTHPLEEDVLEGIARALGTGKISGDR